MKPKPENQRASAARTLSHGEKFSDSDVEYRIKQMRDEANDVISWGIRYEDTYVQHIGRKLDEELERLEECLIRGYKWDSLDAMMYAGMYHGILEDYLPRVREAKALAEAQAILRSAAPELVLAEKVRRGSSAGGAATHSRRIIADPELRDWWKQSKERNPHKKDSDRIKDLTQRVEKEKNEPLDRKTMRSRLRALRLIPPAKRRT